MVRPPPLRHPNPDATSIQDAVTRGVFNDSARSDLWLSRGYRAPQEIGKRIRTAAEFRIDDLILKSRCYRDVRKKHA